MGKYIVRRKLRCTHCGGYTISFLPRFQVRSGILEFCCHCLFYRLVSEEIYDRILLRREIDKEKNLRYKYVKEEYNER